MKLHIIDEAERCLKCKKHFVSKGVRFIHLSHKSLNYYLKTV